MNATEAADAGQSLRVVAALALEVLRDVANDPQADAEDRHEAMTILEDPAVFAIGELLGEECDRGPRT